MRDSEFLELLNLYLDHEISEADAARLEAEVQGNAKRRAIYLEYCRMQKACKVLAVDFQAESQAPEKRVLVARRSSRQVWRSGFFVAGGVALAAACLTVLFVARGGRETGAEAPRAFVQSAKPTPSASTDLNGAPQSAFANSSTRGIVLAGAAADPGAGSRVTMFSDSLVLSGNKQAEVVFASTSKNGDDQLAWVRDFQLVSLQERNQLEQLRFETAPPTLRPEGRPLGGRAPAEATVEMTAFRFRK
jgi:hypothetical protein